jgi:replicative DNA helicase
MIAGPPGVGKSAVVWDLAQGFGLRQMPKERGKRVSCLVLSMEMTLPGSSSRVATSITGINGDKLREGEINADELALIIKHWKAQAELPLLWNFASNFRMSQLRALVVEAVRKHNVGLVVVDHFRMFDPDRRINNANQEDEAKARFLKEDIAKDLNVAVICLAHTVKLRREDGQGDGRPQLSDLRGSGQTAAHCDVVGFMHMPWMFATDVEKDEGVVTETQAEMIYRKNRSGKLGVANFDFYPEKMRVND